MKRLIVLLMLMAVTGCAIHRGGLVSASRSIVNIGPFRGLEAGKQQARIQACFDRAGSAPAVFHFAPGDYVICDAKGLRVPSDSTLIMEGARFLLSKEIQSDGQAFLLDGVANVCIKGGEIIGARAVWNDATNVAGIRVTDAARNIRIQGLICQDLSSNAVGVFGTVDTFIRDVFLSAVVAVNCCNEYVDYLQPNKGPAPGSDRCDQGTVAFYYVDGWQVTACRFAGSHSDGTHFSHCRNGCFNNCTVEDSRMGGYFLEGCEKRWPRAT